MSGSKAVESARQYCLQTLRRYDYPSYLLHSSCPSRGRDAFLALRAFNVDLALIPDQVSQPVVGRMRYQFWTESIDKVFRDVPPAQPVCVLLHHCLTALGVQLTKPYLLRMVSERERRIDDMAFSTVDHLERYAERTHSTLLYLQLESLGVRRPQVDDVAQHIGLATGIVSVLRGFPYYLAKRQVAVPAEICTKVGLAQEDLIRAAGGAAASSGKDAAQSTAGVGIRLDPALRQKLQDATFALATRANDHLISADVRARDDLPAVFAKSAQRSATTGVTSGASTEAADASSVLLAKIPPKLFLERLEKCDFDPTSPQLLKREWTLPYRLWRGK